MPRRNKRRESERKPALLADGGERVEQVARRARQAVEPRHHEDVAFVELADDLGQLGAVGLRAARFLAVHLGAAGGP